MLAKSIHGLVLIEFTKKVDAAKRERTDVIRCHNPKREANLLGNNCTKVSSHNSLPINIEQSLPWFKSSRVKFYKEKISYPGLANIELSDFVFLNCIKVM